ncbi:DUF4232 domain-containing protein [Streptomyces sp. NPDC051561]|uniref:DUF4232 domain-containing protein n=1 Tax=Streptomyces sp. NPDC051561 TaxID=3365658 RepID=UPI0037954763
MRATKLTLATLAVVAGLSLTACQNDGDAVGKGDPSSPASASTSGGSGPDSKAPSSAGSEGTGSTGGKSDEPQGTVAGTGTNENGKIGACRTDELDISAVDATVGGDAEGTVAVEFKNGAGRDCSLAGYAGVDLKTNAGDLSAKRTGEKAESVLLKDGKSTFFGITYPVNNSGGSGVKITGLVVTPPGETKSITLDWPGKGSLPVTDGSGSPVKVGPMGSAGQGGAQ